MLSIRTDKNQVPCLLYSISFRNIPTIKVIDLYITLLYKQSYRASQKKTMREKRVRKGTRGSHCNPLE